MNSDLDHGIEKNLDAALIQSKMRDAVKYEVKSGVVTLTGEVKSKAMRYERREGGGRYAKRSASCERSPGQESES